MELQGSALLAGQSPLQGDVKKLITDAKNICVIPSQTNEPESLTAALALFYTLKELNKNVNLIVENFPEKLNFLIPSLDFISQPKNLIISIPKNVADVSQVYYEKNEGDLKIHLTLDRGNIKKDNISFYFSDIKPDLVITLGINDFKKELENKLDSFGFILNSPILNIDNQLDNKKFGQVNIVEEKSISEIVMSIIKSINSDLAKKDVANCVLAGMILYYKNFKDAKTNPQVLKTSAELMEKGANYQQVTENIYKITVDQIKFLSSIFKNLKFENQLDVAALESDEFSNFGEPEATEAIEKIKTLGIQDDLLVLWKSHLSDPAVKGFFYSKKSELIGKIGKNGQNTAKNGWVYILEPGEDILKVKEQIIKSLQ